MNLNKIFKVQFLKNRQQTNKEMKITLWNPFTVYGILMFNYFFKCFCAKKIWQDSLYNILRNFLFYDTVNPAAP